MGEMDNANNSQILEYISGYVFVHKDIIDIESALPHSRNFEFSPEQCIAYTHRAKRSFKLKQSSFETSLKCLCNRFGC